MKPSKKLMGALLVGGIALLAGALFLFVKDKPGAIGPVLNIGKEAETSLQKKLPFLSEKNPPLKPSEPSKEKKPEGKESIDHKPQEKDSSPNEDTDKRLLRSLWLVKKDKPTTTSDTASPIYIEETSLYGLPNVFKQELFAPTNMLFLPDDPSDRAVQFPSSSQDSSSGHKSIFWIQLGSFPSIVKAQKIASYFKNKGYQVVLYQGGIETEQSFYFVRLKETGSQEKMLKKARIIKELESITPVLIEINSRDRAIL